MEDRTQTDGDDRQQGKPQSAVGGGFNIAMPTLGGLQVWADERVYFDWRIQRNVLTKHCRLLDGKNQRRGWGNYEQCAEKLEQIKSLQNLPPMRGSAVVVLHGLFRTRHSMEKLCRYLRKEGGFLVLNVGYPTTRAPVADHARRLALVLSRLDEVDEVSFVCHSMGNIVVRHYLADRRGEAQPAQRGPRIARMVMLGPPNHGAELAKKLVPIDFSRQVLGKAARELGSEWNELEPHLATPDFEFGIIAGGTDHAKGRNPLISGDDDLIVSVESTRLAGARDYRVLPLWHTKIMDDKQVQEYTLRFLREGYFVSEETRQPIERDQ